MKELLRLLAYARRYLAHLLRSGAADGRAPARRPA